MVDDLDRMTESESVNWEPLLAFLIQLRRHIVLFAVMAAVAITVVAPLYSVLSPSYTAQAIVGPSGPSPVDSLISGASSTAVSGVARRLLGSSGSPSNDSFQEYLELLHSSRLAKILVQKDNMLPRIFPNRWDFVNHRWRPTGTIHAIVTPFKKFLHRPVTEAPDLDALTQALQARLGITRPGSGGVASLLTAADNPYTTVTYSSTSPEDAEEILTIILNEADQIIREDQRRNVTSRLAFLNAKMPTVTLTDQRDTLISILSSQEQLQMMVAADNRFASTMIDPPYASRTPTWPASIFTYFFAALGICFVAWVALVYGATKSPAIRRFTRKFETSSGS